MTADHTKRLVEERFMKRLSRRNAIKSGALGLSAAAMSPALAGAAPGRSKVSASSFRSAQDPITLQVTVWLGDPEFKAMQELAGHFTEANPNVQVEFINIIDGGPWGRDKLQQMIAGGTPPDLMMMNTGQFEAFGSRGVLANLEERVASEDGVDLGIYFPAAVDGCRIEGELHGLPKDISDHVVYLNTAFFEAAGVELPSNEWDWNEFRDVATQLTNADQQKWGTSINNSVWSWGAFVVSNGGRVMNDERTECHLTEPEAVEALQYYYGLLTEDQVSVPPGTLPQTPGGGDQFLGELVGMYMAGPWFRPGLVENDVFPWTIRLFPRVPDSGEPPTSVLYTDQWAMSNETEHPDEAWALLKFLAGMEGQTLWSDIYGSRSIVPIEEIARSDAWLNYGGEEHRADNQLILDQLERTVPPPTNFGDGAEVENVWNEQLDLVMVEQQTVEEAVQIICDSIGGGISGP